MTLLQLTDNACDISNYSLISFHSELEREQQLYTNWLDL